MMTLYAFTSVRKRQNLPIMRTFTITRQEPLRRVRSISSCGSISLETERKRRVERVHKVDVLVEKLRRIEST